MSAFYNKAFETYKAEAQEKWGKTDAYKEQAEKTKNYSQDRWQDAADGMQQIFAEFAVCRERGETADSEAAQLLAQKLQRYITDNFYTCTKEILAGLGQMYVLDERFRENIDQNGRGTAEFASQAIGIYCRK